ncbi:mandelate racemase/muconate lactonizing enzyme family protein [Neobacillus niacini]|uniref:mandelate racemase/muconate lactonizing enzyme family protein n=1 Tax=Neobacillus niacini TaxID=86668 RepID=UPI002FFEFC9A
MKITDIIAHELEPSGPFKFHDGWPATMFSHVFVRVLTDEGHEGHFITWLMNIGEFETQLPSLKSLLVGKEPYFVEQINQHLQEFNIHTPSSVISAIDICLWDLIGKKHGEPIYRLLGAARDNVRAYASTHNYETDQEYIDLALTCKELGFKAFKLHPYGIPEKDIRLCRSVREAVGPEMELMLDPVNAYDRQGALKVGRVLDELNFTWFEAPILDTDIHGLVQLRNKLKTPIAGAESDIQGLRTTTRYLEAGALDQIRSIGDREGGISAMRKIAAVCEAFNVKFEPHSFGPPLVQAAHFHVMLSILNCDYVELPVPLGLFDKGMKDVLKPDANGYVHAPTKPGLGYEVDMEEIERLTIRKF